MRGTGEAKLEFKDFAKCRHCNGSGTSYGSHCKICDGAGFTNPPCRGCKGSGLSLNFLVDEMILNIPAETPNGHQILVRGKGEPGKDGIYGNLHVVILED